MDESTEQLREDIERTRERLGEDVGALSYKTDVKARAGDQVQAARDRVADAVADARESISGRTESLSAAAPSPEDAKRVVRRSAGLAKENPLGLAIGAAVVGLLIVLVLRRRGGTPSTL